MDLTQHIKEPKKNVLFFPIELSYNNTGLLYGFITFFNLIRNVNIEKLQLLNNTNRINITA